MYTNSVMYKVIYFGRNNVSSTYIVDQKDIMRFLHKNGIK